MFSLLTATEREPRVGDFELVSKLKGFPSSESYLCAYSYLNERFQHHAPTPQQGELLGSGDEEDVEFLEALKGLVDGAVKLLGADKGMGAWLMSGLLTKSGVIDVRMRVVPWPICCIIPLRTL